MIEVIDVRHEASGCHVRLGCACGKPALYVHDFHDDQLLFCKGCGAFASHRRLSLKLDLPQEQQVVWDNVTISNDCPMINVALPVMLEFIINGNGKSDTRIPVQAGRLTKLSPDHCLVRLARETLGEFKIVGREVIIQSDEMPLQDKVRGLICEEIRPNTGDPITYYNIELKHLSLGVQGRIEDYYEEACGLKSRSRVLLFANGSEGIRLERCLLEVMPKAEVIQLDDEKSLEKVLKNKQFDLVLLPPLVSLMNLAKTAREKGEGRPRLISLLRDTSGGATSQAMLLGADEVLSYQCSLSELWRVVQNEQRASLKEESLGGSALGDAAAHPSETQPIRPNLSVLEHETIRMLCMASETHDANSSNHLLRMSAYSAAIATQLGWSEMRVSQLATASKLHDVGKIGVPDVVLKKTGTLSAEERQIMQQHARFGYHILQASNLTTLRMGASIALRHHERWDGKGYPDGVSGDSIPVEAQIVSVADVFDALTTARAYKPAWDNERAIDFIRQQSGQMFNPSVVEAFKRALPEILRAQLRFIDDFRDVWTERRRHARYAIQSLPVSVEVVMPEETFQPYALEGSICNLSEGGAKIIVTNLNNDLYLQLTTARRYARINAQEGFGAEPQLFMCEIVWNDYYALPDPNACLLGLNFQKIRPETIDLIQDLIDRIGQPIGEATSTGIRPAAATTA